MICPISVLVAPGVRSAALRSADLNAPVGRCRNVGLSSKLPSRDQYMDCRYSSTGLCFSVACFSALFWLGAAPTNSASPTSIFGW